MSRRRGRMWRCPWDTKTGFSSWRLATAALHRLSEPGWIYWCRRGGCYHLTRYPREEYDRRRITCRAGAA